MRLFTYIVAYDSGIAPNPYYDTLTLNLCKPKIRKAAQVGDWIIGGGSANVPLLHRNADYSGKIVYAMKVTDCIKMEEYDSVCNDIYSKLSNKRPSTLKWPNIVGDCHYNFTISETHPGRRSILLGLKHMKTDLGGLNTLLSNHFFYFGINAIAIPREFGGFLKNNIGHSIFDDAPLVQDFIHWLENNFTLNTLYGEPQLKWKLLKEGKIDISCDQ